MKTLLLLSALSMALTARAQSTGDQEAVRACLGAWKEHPFKGEAQKNFRVLSPSVKIMGIGGRDLNDDQKTAEPELILIKPSVNVMSKSVFKLMNPNGWYCIKSTTAVMGKAEFEVGCKVQVASADDSKVGVLGAADNEGVAVMGSIRFKRLPCL